MNQKRSGGVNGFTLLAFVIFLFTSLWLTNQFDERENQLTWAEFEKVIVSNDVKEVLVSQNKTVPTGQVKIEIAGKDGEDSEVKYLYVSDVNEVQEYMRGKNVKYGMSDVPEDSWFATNLLPILLMILGFGLLDSRFTAFGLDFNCSTSCYG